MGVVKGNNAISGLLIGFEHNQATAEELARNGFEIVTADEVIREERRLQPGFTSR